MVFIETLQLWVAIDYGGSLATSADGLAWTPLPSSLFPLHPPQQPPSWGFEFSNIIEYTSLVPSTGSNIVAPDVTLYLFYCFVRGSDPGGWAGAVRGLAAVEVSITPERSASNGSVLLTLTQYAKVEPPAHHWATTTPVNGSAFAFVGRIAATFASPSDAAARESELVALLDCVWLDAAGGIVAHFVGRPGECGPANGPGTWPPLPAPNSERTAYLGPLGWVAASNSSALAPHGYAFVPLWRCWDPSSGEFVCLAGDFPCVAAGVEDGHEAPQSLLLGWALNGWMPSGENSRGST